MKNRKSLYFILAALTVIVSITFMKYEISGAQTNVSVELDGKPLSFEVPPQIIKDRTMLPFRAIAEAMGAEVNWDPDLRKITMHLSNKYAIMTINDPILIHGEFKGVSPSALNVEGLEGSSKYEMDSPPVIVNDRTLVPLRAISEALGAKVDWDAQTFTAKITTEKQAEEKTQTEREGEGETEATPTPTPTPAEAEHPPKPTIANINDLENIHIDVNENNPSKARVTLKGFEIPKALKVTRENGKNMPIFSVQFSSDGTNTYSVVSEVPQGVSGIIAVRELDHYLIHESSGVSKKISLSPPNLVEVTGSSIVWDIEIPKAESINMKELTHLSFKAEFYEDNRYNIFTGSYENSDGEWVKK